MVKLRLKRTGKKFHAVYKVVASDARAPRDGKFIDELGHYDPHTKQLVLNEELTTKYLNNGARPTDTVRTLLKRNDFYKNYVANKNK